MKNQKKNAEKKVELKNENWLTPEQAAKKLGLSFNIENTHIYKVKNAKKNADN